MHLVWCSQPDGGRSGLHERIAALLLSERGLTFEQIARACCCSLAEVKASAARIGEPDAQLRWTAPQRKVSLRLRILGAPDGDGRAAGLAHTDEGVPPGLGAASGPGPFAIPGEAAHPAVVSLPRQRVGRWPQALDGRPSDAAASAGSAAPGAPAAAAARRTAR